jgi:hypothetical protein
MKILIRVSPLRDRVFIFDVYFKEVGFMIRDLRKHIAKEYNCYFHLWGFGGPNWRLEELRWYEEQDREWTDIGPKNPNSQFIDLLLKVMIDVIACIIPRSLCGGAVLSQEPTLCHWVLEI